MHQIMRAIKPRRKLRLTRVKDEPPWSLIVAVSGPDPAQPKRCDQTILPDALANGSVRDPDHA